MRWDWGCCMWCGSMWCCCGCSSGCCWLWCWLSCCDNSASWNWLLLEGILPAIVSLADSMVILEATWGNCLSTWKHTWTVLHLHAGLQITKNVSSTTCGWGTVITNVNAVVLISLALDQNCSPGVADHVALHGADLFLSWFALLDKLGC